MSSEADAIIVGAGIAGCEAAWRCAAGGLDVVLVTTSLDTVYNLASDTTVLAPPAGSLMRALLGPRAKAAAVRSWDLHRAAKYAIEAQERIHLVQSTVTEVLVDDSGAAAGARTWEGVDRPARLTALCVGSFLRARLTSGAVTETHGRLSEMAYDDLYDWLAGRGFGFVSVRFEGTPHGGSLAYVVESVALASDERVGQGPPSAELWRMPGLFAAGVCLAPPRGAGAPSEAAGDADSSDPSQLTYEAVAGQGMALGDELVTRLRGGG